MKDGRNFFFYSGKVFHSNLYYHTLYKIPVGLLTNIHTGFHSGGGGLGGSDPLLRIYGGRPPGLISKANTNLMYKISNQVINY